MSRQADMIQVALAGNPNTGKSSLFNALTGLNQKVSNYPGITVEKKTGTFHLTDGRKVHLTDLPGTYSLHTSSPDEEIALHALADMNNPDRPDLVVVVADATNLRRNLYLFTQIVDLGLPVLLALNLSDQVDRKGIEIDEQLLSEGLGVPALAISARKRRGIDTLKQYIERGVAARQVPVFQVPEPYREACSERAKTEGLSNTYAAWLWLGREGEADATELKRLRLHETVHRYNYIEDVLKLATRHVPEKDRSRTGRLDSVLVHPLWGLAILFGLLFLIFQAIFSWAEVPMNAIDAGFNSLSGWLGDRLPGGFFSDLLSEGVIPGIAGVVIFLPQIIILFAGISFLEESGYMSRVVFLMDNLLKRFGLSGKSVVPLISGTACAIPAIMAARNIEQRKQRLLTILVTPFMTCSARLPVYTVLIGLVIPAHSVMGLQLQGLVLLGLYLLGFVAALFTAQIMSRVMRSERQSDFIVEMPSYRRPHLRNMLHTIYEKSKGFVLNAGKIILFISMVLWVLASYGPGRNFVQAQEIVQAGHPHLTGAELEQAVSTYELEHSYIGLLGRFIEPVIAPLGYDWKIGIAILASFAAREVFVGTMATIYSVGSEDELTVMERLGQEKHPQTGEPLFNLALGISLLLFYAFAMQCVSTLSVVKQETGSWKWPVIQMLFMTGLAYVTALLAYQGLQLL